MEKHRQLKPELSRMDTLTDGVFAIVAALLVLDIKLPDIQLNYTSQELIQSLKDVLPSFIAFAFSFMTVHHLLDQPWPYHTMNEALRSTDEISEPQMMFRICLIYLFPKNSSANIIL